MERLEISLHRHADYLANSYGRWLPLSVFFDGSRIGSISTGETKTFTLPDSTGMLRVVMTIEDLSLGRPPRGALDMLANFSPRSIEVQIATRDANGKFETGTKSWVTFDFFGLTSIPFLANHTFFLRRVHDGQK